MSLECVNVMNKQELGSNSSKTVEHGHDACDSHKSSDREEGEVEDGEIDDDDEGKIDDSSGSPNISDKASKRKNADEADSDNENHGSKRHKERKRRHKKEKRHHHVSHKRRHQSPEHPNSGSKNDGSPQLKKSRRSDEEHRGKHFDYDRPPSGDEDLGSFGQPRPGQHRTSGSSRAHNGSRRRSQRSESSQREPIDERDSLDSAASPCRDGEGFDRMQDLFSDGDDLDLDVAAHERDGAFQRNQMRPERPQPKAKKKKNKAKWKEHHWPGKPRREEEMPRKWETERKRCRFYMEGRCGKADHCPFSHDFKPPKKLELCKFYAISSCLKGEYCVYMHDDFPCKFYHTGNRSCKFEDDCKFSHQPLTPETKMVLERFLEERPFNICGTEEERHEEISEILDDRKNSLLGSPPSYYKDRNRNRMAPRDPSGLLEPIPDRMGPPGPQGPSGPPANFAHRLSPNGGPGLGPPGSAMSPPQNAPPSAIQQPGMPPHQRPFGFQAMPDSIGLRPPLAGMRQLPTVVSGPPPTASGPPMLLAGRGVAPASFGARMLAMRPPANMVAPQNALPPGMGFPGPRPVGPPGSNPQLDNLANMLVQAAKQQGKRPEEEAETTSMLKAAGADDSDLEEEADSLDAMVQRMRKDAEEQQRQRGLQAVPRSQGFEQAMPRPVLPPEGPQPLFPVRPPGYSPQMPGPPPAFLPPRPPFEPQPQEKAAQMYLRIAKQTANGMQEQLAREQKAEAAAETPASPPPPADTELEPRAWKLIALDVPLKTPYPLMRLPHDLPYSRSDPRLTGQLRLAGAKQESPQPQHPQQPQPPQPQHSRSPHQQQPPPQQQSPPPAPQPPSKPQPPAAADLGGRTYTPSLSQPKDPRLGRPEVPAALLQKPPPALPLEVDLEPPDRPPPKMQLSERSSSFQAAAPTQHESRAYLLDPRFRRRKASLPSSATPENPEAKNTTPVPSSGESSPVE